MIHVCMIMYMYYGTDPVHDNARKSITTSKPDLTENKENIRFLKFEKEDFAKFLSEQENQRTKTRQSNTFNYFKITCLQEKKIPAILTHWIQPP